MSRNGVHPHRYVHDAAPYYVPRRHPPGFYPSPEFWDARSTWSIPPVGHQQHQREEFFDVPCCPHDCEEWRVMERIANAVTYFSSTIFGERNQLQVAQDPINTADHLEEYHESVTSLPLGHRREPLLPDPPVQPEPPTQQQQRRRVTQRPRTRRTQNSKQKIIEENSIRYRYQQVHRNGQEFREECAVCITEFEVNADVRRLQCLHVYHVTCIDCWLRKNSHCPTCRTKLN